MNKKTFDELTLIRGELSEKVNNGVNPFSGYRKFHSCFPHGCCVFAAKCVREKLGFSVVRGGFILYRGDRVYDHAWNETPDGEIVDLTADQFSLDLPYILVTPKNSDLAREHYLESRTHFNQL